MDFKSDAVNRYADIMDLPHHVSVTRTRMSVHDRAAQFSPFAALTGYEAVIKESGRLTDKRMELDEDNKATLNERIQLLMEHLGEKPEVTITYFQPDERKAGGAYVQTTGQVKKVDEYESAVIMVDGLNIPIEQIYEIECELFENAEFL